MYLLHPRHTVWVLQSFCLGQNWDLSLLLAPSGAAAARPMEKAGCSGRASPSSWSRALRAAAVAAFTAFTTAADTSVRGMRSLGAMNGVTRAFPSCSRNRTMLFPRFLTGRSLFPRVWWWWCCHGLVLLLLLPRMTNLQKHHPLGRSLRQRRRHRPLLRRRPCRCHPHLRHHCLLLVCFSVCFSICLSVRFSVWLFHVLFGFRGWLLGE